MQDESLLQLLGFLESVGNGRFGPVQCDPTRSQIHSQFSKHKIIFHKDLALLAYNLTIRYITYTIPYLLTQQKGLYEFN